MTIRAWLMATTVAAAGFGALQAQAADQRIQSALSGVQCADFDRAFGDQSWESASRENRPAFGKPILDWTTADFQYLYQYGANCIAQTTDKSFVASDQQALHRDVNRVIEIINFNRQQYQEAAAAAQSTAQMDAVMAQFLEKYRGYDAIDGQFSSAELQQVKAEADRLLDASTTETPTERQLLTFSRRIDNLIYKARARERAANTPQLSEADNQNVQLGSYYGMCSILAAAAFEEDVAKNAYSKSLEVAASVRHIFPGESIDAISSFFQENGNRHIPANPQVRRQVLEQCKENL